jgi:hypothetical protein
MPGWMAMSAIACARSSRTDSDAAGRCSRHQEWACSTCAAAERRKKTGASPQAAEQVIGGNGSGIFRQRREKGSLIVGRRRERRLAVVGDHADRGPFDQSFRTLGDDDAISYRTGQDAHSRSIPRLLLGAHHQLYRRPPSRSDLQSGVRGRAPGWSSDGS